MCHRDLDDLRFRVWEVDSLFTDHYGQRLSVAELTPLARNTEGWATALHLFHLASLRAPSRRTQLINEIRAQSVVLRHYLVDQVLGALEPDELALISQVAVFEYVRADLVTGLIGRRGSGLVDRLHQLGLLTATGIPGEFHLHSLLRDQLLDLFASRAGHSGLLGLYQRAGAVLERSGLTGQAARAYLRAGRFGDAHRLDGTGISTLNAAELASGSGGDPWHLWAQATVELRRGAQDAALRLLLRARSLFPSPPAALDDMSGELAAWLAPPPVPEPAHPWGGLRRWLAGDDSAAVILWADPGLAGAIHELIDQCLRNDWDNQVSYRATDRLCQILFRLVEAFTRLLAGRDAGDALSEIELLVQTGVDCPVLERLFLALSAPEGWDRPAPGERSVLDRLRAQAERDGDPFSPCLLDIIELARQGDPGLPAAMVGAGLGRLAPLVGRAAPAPARVEPPVAVQHFINLTGTFRIGDLDETDDAQPLRPQHLAMLQLLTLHAAQWIERDQLLRWFWPDVEEETGLRRLATALSAIRKALEPLAPSVTLERRGNLYRLDPGSGTSDLAHLTARLRSAELEMASNLDLGLDHLQECLVMQRGPLLPSAECAGWLDGPRWELEGRWERAIQAVFDAVNGDPPGRVIELLPELIRNVSHSDSVWRGAIDLAEQADSPLLARQIRQRYERMLED